MTGCARPVIASASYTELRVQPTCGGGRAS